MKPIKKCVAYAQRTHARVCGVIGELMATLKATVAPKKKKLLLCRGRVPQLTDSFVLESCAH